MVLLNDLLYTALMLELFNYIQEAGPVEITGKTEKLLLLSFIAAGFSML